MKENSNLRAQLDDARITLMINKKLMYKHLSVQINENNNRLFDELREENSRISQINNELYELKLQLQKKIYSIQSQLDDVIMRNQEVIEKEKIYSFKCENKLLERESLIAHLKKELEKYHCNDFKNSKEIIIGDPTIVNVEINKELCEARELMSKYTHMLQIEKREKKELERINERLQAKIQNYKKRKKIKKNMENIEMLGYILSNDESDTYSQSSVKSLGYYLNIESPTVQFPEKIKQPKYLITDLSDLNNAVPKLDLTKVLTKYPPLKKLDIIEYKNSPQYIINDDYTDKLIFQLKIAKEMIIKYKKKNSELKKLVSALKHHVNIFKNQNSISTKDEAPHQPNKRKGDDCINSDSFQNEDFNVRVDEEDNTNTNNRHIFEGSDFNYVIKESIR